MNTKKLFITFLLSVITCATVLSQDDNSSSHGKKTHINNSRYLSAMVFSFFTDGIATPYTAVPNYVQVQNQYSFTNTYVQQGNNAFRLLEYNIVCYGYKGWYNVAQFNDNAALSLGFQPTLGMGFAFSIGKQKMPGGAFSIDVPFLLELHLGNGSTYGSDKDFGFNIGGGVEAIKSPLLMFSDIGEDTYYGPNGQLDPVPSITTFWVEPCIVAGITFWTKFNYPMNLQLKYGFGASKTFVGADGVTPVSGGGQSIGLDLNFMIGY
jgi:hypothetical protein